MADDPRERPDTDELQERLDRLDETIAEARAVDEEARSHWESGQLPQVEGDEGEGNAAKLRT